MPNSKLSETEKKTETIRLQIKLQVTWTQNKLYRKFPIIIIIIIYWQCLTR